MMKKTMAAFALAMMAVVFAFSGPASEAKSAWSVGFGGPVYGGAYYGPPAYAYRVPRRVVYGPPVVYAPAPVYYAPAPCGPAYGGFSFTYGNW
jgi:hypothetical protein